MNSVSMALFVDRPNCVHICYNEQCHKIDIELLDELCSTMAPVDHHQGCDKSYGLNRILDDIVGGEGRRQTTVGT